MSRKRLTQVFPFLLPIRKWQRKTFFYLKMYFDRNKYAREMSKKFLPYKVCDTTSLLLNQNSGFDMKFQLNKVHNLKLASKTINHIIIKPNETFSFWRLVKSADKKIPYKDGLNFVEGKIVGDYGGGLCQLSNMLFWLFLHTPMTITERHCHSTVSFPSTTPELPAGIDATISEGWLDLKVKNTTDNTFQIKIDFDDEFMYGAIFSKKPEDFEYEIYNKNVSYFRKNKKVYQSATVYRLKKDKYSKYTESEKLYSNKCEIAYQLPEDIYIEEK